MTDNYAAIIDNNIQRLFAMDLSERAGALPACRQGQAMVFTALGRSCTISPQGLFLDKTPLNGPLGIVISLYALQATSETGVWEPFKSFKDLPNSMPYVGAFSHRTELALVPVVPRLAAVRSRIMEQMGGADAPLIVGGDLAFVVRPLPKIALCYVCYAEDEDFAASVTCLYSRNADCFLTTDALADLGEYTSKAILAMVEASLA